MAGGGVGEEPRGARGGRIRCCGRRGFLRGAGVAVALPWLESRADAAEADGARPRRLVAIETTMGLLPEYYFPRGAGRDYEPSDYLLPLEPYRDRLTVCSGLSHPDVDGGHAADVAFLTGAPHPARGDFRNTVSLDQFAAERIGTETRLPTLALTVAARGTTSLSFTRDGVLVPGERSPARLYREMFLQGSPAETAARIDELRTGRSVLDAVAAGARRLDKTLPAADRDRMERYFTSVREVERRLERAEVWEKRRRPRPKAPPPPEQPEQELFTLLRLMGRMTRLALETDTTRLVTMFVNPAQWVPRTPGVVHETHSLTHHGNRPEMIAELKRVEEMQFVVLGEFLAELDAVREGDGSLLDHTMVLHGSCMGNANAHSNTDLPVLVAGGGFRHAGHLVFPAGRAPPLSNLFLSLLGRLGVEADAFAGSTGTLTGLEPA